MVGKRMAGKGIEAEPACWARVFQQLHRNDFTARVEKTLHVSCGRTATASGGKVLAKILATIDGRQEIWRGAAPGGDPQHIVALAAGNGGARHVR